MVLIPLDSIVVSIMSTGFAPASHTAPPVTTGKSTGPPTIALVEEDITLPEHWTPSTLSTPSTAQLSFPGTKKTISACIVGVTNCGCANSQEFERLCYVEHRDICAAQDGGCSCSSGSCRCAMGVGCGCREKAVIRARDLALQVVYKSL